MKRKDGSRLWRRYHENRSDGSKTRPMKEEWVLSIKGQAERQGTAFFFKQWGTWGMTASRETSMPTVRLLEARSIRLCRCKQGKDSILGSFKTIDK